MTGGENPKPRTEAIEPSAIAPDTASRPTVPDYLARVLDEFASVKFELSRLSRRPLPDRLSPIVVCVVKNERDRLVDFLHHYRAAGIERFVFIDNESTDGTFELLQRQPDIDLYRRPGGFDWMRKQGWISKIIEIYGHQRWYIYADADEHIVFDEIPERSFADLTREMECRRIRRVRGFLLDMYGAGPVLESHYVPGASLAAAYPFFDREGYRETVYKEVISVKGGPRLRAFGAADPKFLPELTKYPLFSTEPGEYMVNPHHIWPYDDNFKSDRYLAILHYKFLPGMMTKVREAIEAKNYWDGSLEYRCYAKVLQADPALSLIAPVSARLDRPADLVELGLIARLDWPQTQNLVSRVTVAWRKHLAVLIGDGAVAPTA
jgi:Glycosyl transferase family 2